MQPALQAWWERDWFSCLKLVRSMSASARTWTSRVRENCINGGCFILRKGSFDYLHAGDELVTATITEQLGLGSSEPYV